MDTRIIHFRLLVLLCCTLTGQLNAQFTIEHDTITSDIKEYITEQIADQIKSAVNSGEQHVFTTFYIREMLEPLQAFGVDPENTEFVNGIYETYTDLKKKKEEDPSLDVEAEVSGMVKDRIKDGIKTYLSGHIDTESWEILEQLQDLMGDARDQIEKILKATEEIGEIPEDEVEVDHEISKRLARYGLDEKYVFVLEDLEQGISQVHSRVAEPVEIFSTLLTAVRSDDPTEKIKIIFELGSSHGNKIPVVGSIVKALFDVGTELLNATFRLEKMLDDRFNQGCISPVGQYSWNRIDKYRSFLEQFSSVERACPMSESNYAGIYRDIYINMEDQTETFFYFGATDWRSGPHDPVHTGKPDMQSLIRWLRARQEFDKVSDLEFLFTAYGKPLGFVYYEKRLIHLTDSIQQLLSQSFDIAGTCESQALREFFLYEAGLNWVVRLFSNTDTPFSYDDVKSFTDHWKESIRDQMLTNYYLSQHQDNLVHLERIVDHLVQNMPCVVYGWVKEENGNALANVEISFTQEGARPQWGNTCYQANTSPGGAYQVLFTGAWYKNYTVSVTARTSTGQQQTEQLAIQLGPQYHHQINFFFESQQPVVDPAGTCPPGTEWYEPNRQCIPSLDCTQWPHTIKVYNSEMNWYECRCEPNYVWDPNTASCIPDINAGQEVLTCPDPHMVVVRDPVSGTSRCECETNYIWNAQYQRCVPDIQGMIDRADCSAYPFTQAKWDPQNNQVICDCVNGYQWNYTTGQCEKDIQTRVRESDCTGYYNTQAVWDAGRNEVICDCLPGYIWNPQYSGCDLQQDMIQNADCSGYFNTHAVWDATRHEVLCDCLPGFYWNSNYTGCVPSTQTVTTADCSAYSNTQPVWDAGQNKIVCDCIPGYKWNSNYTACYADQPGEPVILTDFINDVISLIDMMNGGIPGQWPSESPPPQVIQNNCNNFTEAGSDAAEIHQVEMGRSSGTFQFTYKTHSIKDRIIVLYQGTTLYDSGCVGQSQQLALSYSGFSSTITVQVYPNCAGQTGTAWEFTVSCPQ